MTRTSAALFSLLLLCVFLTPGANAQSRARRVTQNPPTLGGASSQSGGSSSRQNPASSAPNNGTEEVGEGDVVRVNTTLVSIPVSVMDRDGKYIPNLRKEDFRIYEDGVEQRVAYFAAVEKPFTVALLMDTSGSTHFKLEDIQDAAIAFIDQLRPEDRVMVVSFDDRINVLSEPTTDHYRLRDAIRSTRTGGGTRLYDAVDFVINQRFNHIEGRKALVLFTDGVDTTSRHKTYEDNVRDAEELDGIVYTVQYDTYEDVQSRGGGGGWPSRGGRRGPTIFNFPFPLPFPNPGGGMGRGRGGGGGAGSSRAEYERADEYLTDMAEKTGGRHYRAENESNIAQSFALIAEELRRQYSIGYYPKTRPQVGQRRQIRVRVNRPDLVVRARDSYIYNPSAASTTAQDNNQTQSKPELKRHFAGQPSAQQADKEVVRMNP